MVEIATDNMQIYFDGKPVAFLNSEITVSIPDNKQPMFVLPEMPLQGSFKVEIVNLFGYSMKKLSRLSHLQAYSKKFRVRKKNEKRILKIWRLFY